MKISFFREQKHYKFSEIREKLKISENECILEADCKKDVEILKKYGIVKSINSNEPDFDDLSDSDEVLADVTDNPGISYKFCFVGVVLVRNSVFCCYPKYIDNNDSPMEEMKTVLEIIRKYKSDSKESVHFYNWADEDGEFNELKVSLYLLYDYFENGTYSNEQTIIETNGEGEIQWDKTINETFAILKRNTPYYIDLQTITNRNDEQDYFKLLHECILTSCSNKLAKAGLLNLFDISPVQLSDRGIDAFGDKEYIKYRLEREIQIQYVTKKQILLKTLYTYISESKNDEISDSVSLYGTNSFNLVWEKACSDIFENIRDAEFKDVKAFKNIEDVLNRIENPNREKKLSPSNKVRDLIEKATWTYYRKKIKSNQTLEPDIISVSEDGRSFFILDAKYYFIECKDQTIKHQPGIQDIVKQFAYHRAFSNFIKECNFKEKYNVFLIPQKTSVKSEDNFKLSGTVELKVMQSVTSDEQLPSIKIVELKPEFVYESYLKGGKQDLVILKKSLEKELENVEIETEKSLGSM